MDLKGIIFFLFFSAYASMGQAQAETILLDIKPSELKRINYKEKHADWKSVEKTCNDVIKYAQNQGFLTSYFDTVKKTTQSLSLQLITGKVYNIEEIYMADSLLKILKPALKEKQLTHRSLTPENVLEIHNNILSFYEDNGYPFVQSQFENITLQNQKFSADLRIYPGPLTTYDTLIIKSDGKVISHAFISNYLKIKKGEPYREKELEKISERIEALQFISEVRAHEITFQKNKAKIYLYLEKGKSSNANGIIGIQPDNQTGKINITGEVQLQLKNVFKIAETIDLEWQKLQPQTQNLDINIQFPMLFNTPFGIDAGFHLYKRDTSFLDIAGRAGVIYTFSNFNHIGVFYQYENSQILNAVSNPQSLGITPVKKNHFGINASFQKFDHFRNPTRGYSIKGQVSFVNRSVTIYEADSISSIEKNNAYEFTIDSKGFIPLGLRHTIMVGAKGFYQFAPQLYRNELFRIGGLNSLRGFDEESINISSAIIGTIEYRFLLDRNSNIFAFFDAAGYESDAVNQYQKDYPFGFGLGINFATNFGTFSLTYALGKQLGNPIKFRSGKIHFGYINTF